MSSETKRTHRKRARLSDTTDNEASLVGGEVLNATVVSVSTNDSIFPYENIGASKQLQLPLVTVEQAIEAVDANLESNRFLSNDASQIQISTDLERLKLFLVTAPSNFLQGQLIKRHKLPTGDTIACVFWNNLYHITGTDIVKALAFRFSAFGRPVIMQKKFEEGVFSDLRNLKPGIDATLEEPRSPLLDFLFKSSCIRTQKKQKVFYWFSVPHDRLFMDALERDLKREGNGQETMTKPIPLLSAEDTLGLARQHCLPTFAVLESSNLATPNNLSRQESQASVLGMTISDIPQFNEKSSLQHEMLHQALNVVAAQNSPFLESANLSYQQPHQHATPSYLPHTPSPNLQHINLRPSQLIAGHFVPSQIDLSRRQSLDVSSFRQHYASSSASVSPQQQPLTVTAPMSLLEGSPNYKSRSRNRVTPSSLTIGSGKNLSVSSEMQNKGEKRIFTCGAFGCGQNFKRFEHLRRHFRLHTGEKPYLCEYCGKTFTRIDGLSSHLRIHGMTQSEIGAVVRTQALTDDVHTSPSTSDQYQQQFVQHDQCIQQPQSEISQNGFVDQQYEQQQEQTQYNPQVLQYQFQQDNNQNQEQHYRTYQHQHYQSYQQSPYHQQQQQHSEDLPDLIQESAPFQSPDNLILMTPLSMMAASNAIYRQQQLQQHQAYQEQNNFPNALEQHIQYRSQQGQQQQHHHQQQQQLRINSNEEFSTFFDIDEDVSPSVLNLPEFLASELPADNSGSVFKAEADAVISNMAGQKRSAVQSLECEIRLI
ncbi:homeodomain transcription factor ste12 [Physocladia obscura]|uniref:Homeodomain transcription factor ste12 n=1 Tax=Physocladia obscura TaxID=109957 RepID=A0AAD5SWL5_9FUNG|nr:homeodomain transcription factor ste12 [Physocladia obscura]